MMGGGTTVVALATFRRPGDLRQCLRALAQLSADASDWQGDVIVVDNDALASARPVVEEFGEGPTLRIQYAVEPEPGIAAARNRCVALATGYEYLAFLDDDEMPQPMWLQSLLDTARAFDADLTGGPVVAVYDQDPPRWAVESRVFDRVNRSTGLTAQPLATNNLLIRLEVQEHLGRLFNPAYGLTGGSDRELCVRARQAGLRLAWSGQAVVEERVPASRLSVSWVVRRGFRVGNAAARMDLDLGASSRRGVLERAAKMWAGAARQLLLGLANRRPGSVILGLRRVAKGAGAIAGLAGWRYQEYRRQR